MTTAAGTAVSAIRQEPRGEHGVPTHRIPVCRPPSAHRGLMTLHHFVVEGRSRCQSAGQRTFDPIRTQLMGRTHPIIVAHNHRESPVGAPDDSSNATLEPNLGSVRRISRWPNTGSPLTQPSQRLGCECARRWGPRFGCPVCVPWIQHRAHMTRSNRGKHVKTYKRRSGRVLGATLASLMVFAVACGGGDDGGSSGNTDTTEGTGTSEDRKSVV